MGWPSVVVCVFGLVAAVSGQCGIQSYTAYPNQHILGGTLDSTAVDVNSCKSNCNNDVSCFAVDVVLNPFRCYRLSDPTASRLPEVGTTHYRMWQTCNSDSNSCIYQGFSSYRFTNYYTEETRSYDYCARRCTDLGTGCVGFSHQQTTSKCQLATSAAALTSANLLKDVTWRSMKKGDCTTNCNPFFTKKTDRSSVGGLLQQGINTEAGCKTACTRNNKCVGFDLDRTGTPATCWIHEIKTNLDADRATPGISQYILVERCPQSACSPSYSKNLNTNSPFGILDTAQTSELSCKMTCAADYYCLGFDFVPNPPTGLPQCWIHRNQTNFSKKQTSSGVNQYTLINRCPQGTVTQATTTSGGCTTTYVKKQDTSSPYGQRVGGSSSEAECKLACDSRTDCVAIDLDLTGTTPSCWLHTAASDLNEVRSTPGIHQYVKTSICTGGSTTRMASTTSSGGCQTWWDSRPDTSSVGASLQAGITTLSDCQTGCINTVNCVAVDFNTRTSPFQCWFHSDMATVNNKRSDPGVNQYILDRCYQGSRCQIKWKPLNSMKSYGAMLQSGLTNVDDCLNACINKPSCVAVDFNTATNPNQCWFHEDANNLVKKVTDNGVTQYVLDRCYSDTCVIRWNNATYTSSVGAMLQSSITTLDACLNGCISQPTCVAVDYNFQTSPQQCWFHDDLAKVNVKRTDSQTNQYVLDRCFQSECPKFTEYKNLHAIGGIRQNQITTNTSCRQACLNSVDCQGYDFDSMISGCFIFNMANKKENLLFQSGTNHYELLCRSGETLPPSSVSSTTRPACTPVWTEELNKHGMNGQYQSSIRTLADCKAQCLITVYCTAIDYVPTTSQCYLYTVPYNSAPISGVNHYTLKRCVFA